jgi:beta-glucosidase
VQVYASRADSDVERPQRWLAGFTLVDAQPGRTATTQVNIPIRTLQHWDVETKTWVIEPGTFTLETGSSSDVLPHSTVVRFLAPDGLSPVQSEPSAWQTCEA